MKKLVFIQAIALVLVILLLGGCSSKTTETKTTETKTTETKSALEPAKTYNWRLTTPLPAGATIASSVKEFVKELEQRTNGKVKITMYEGTLGSPPDAWDMVKSNNVQLTFTADAYNPSRMPISTMVSLPFEISDPKTTGLVLNAWLKAGYLKELNDNFKVIFFKVVYPLNIFLRDKKVTTMDDFKGLKIRTSVSVNNATITALGATGISMAGSEAYMGLDRGVIDGNMIPIDRAVDAKYDEVTKYALKDSFGGGAFVFLMNKETWNSLPPDLQQLIDQIANDVSTADLDRFIAREQELWEAYGKKAEVYTVSKDELAKWKKAVSGIPEKYAQDMTAKGYPAIEALNLMRKIANENSK